MFRCRPVSQDFSNDIQLTEKMKITYRFAELEILFVYAFFTVNILSDLDIFIVL